MAINTVDIDWGYLLERLEHMLDLGEEMLTRQLAEYQPPPEAFRRCRAFRWQRRGNGGYLEAIEHPDIPELGDLIGLDRTLNRLRQNTRQFVMGHPANNVLLWGERGTGKSSAVKGLLGEFGEAGLRLVEVHKEDLFQLPAITEQLRARPYRFVLFSDDLSFDESEVSYRELKGLLEGGLEARPANVLVYATSNRRHLMPERFADNTGESEIHAEEAISEKLSLSDRFGITIGFYPMNQETYLAITRHLAKTRGLRVTRKSLEKQALQWALLRGARSGRVARQFVDDLHGRLALEGKTGPSKP